ncbi:hypothetical protein RB653_000846 [Dictyostelium firmibasis]|uniref:FNIP repeat-containing protein n=1 Tax=Dictyostelium firmibasis TaxID=79012 RepID=A0AAN7YY80_9MYCE
MVIFYHIRLLNFYEIKENHSFTIKQLKSFKFKDHLSILRLKTEDTAINNPIVDNGFISGELSKLIPVSVKNLVLEINNQLVVGDIKEGLISLKLGKKYDQKLTPGLLPMDGSLIEFNSGRAFRNGDLELLPGSIPSSITSLTFGYSFNSVINENILPKGLLKLKLKGFNKLIIRNSLPTSLLDLELGRNYNRAISAYGTLPSSLTSLTLGQRFVHVIYTGTLPPTLKKLIIQSINYNQRFEKRSLPDALEHLEFHKNGFFNQPIGDKYLPPNLKTLILPRQWSNNLEPILPQQIPIGVTNLQFHSNECSLFLRNDSIPLSVLNLRVNGILSNHISYSKGCEKILKGSFIPPSVTQLETGTIVNLSHCINLKNFILDESFNQRSLTKDSIPLSVINFKLPALWDRKLSVGILPNSIKVLDLGSFNHEIEENVLPQNLESLTMNSWDQPSINKNIFPQSLTFLSIKSFNQRLTPSTLPKKLEILILYKYNVLLIPNCFPNSIKLIKLGPIFEKKNILYPFNNNINIRFGKNDLNLPIYPKNENLLRCSV